MDIRHARRRYVTHNIFIFRHVVSNSKENLHLTTGDTEQKEQLQDVEDQDVS